MGALLQCEAKRAAAQLALVIRVVGAPESMEGGEWPVTLVRIARIPSSLAPPTLMMPEPDGSLETTLLSSRALLRRRHPWERHPIDPSEQHHAKSPPTCTSSHTHGTYPSVTATTVLVTPFQDLDPQIPLASPQHHTSKHHVIVT
jgi:hypothetical protein